MAILEKIAEAKPAQLNEILDHYRDCLNADRAIHNLLLEPDSNTTPDEVDFFRQAATALEESIEQFERQFPELHLAGEAIRDLYRRQALFEADSPLIKIMNANEHTPEAIPDAVLALLKKDSPLNPTQQSQLIEWLTGNRVRASRKS